MILIQRAAIACACQAQGAKNEMRNYYRMVSLLLLTYRLESCQTKALLCVTIIYTCELLEQQVPNLSGLAHQHLGGGGGEWMVLCE